MSSFKPKDIDYIPRYTYNDYVKWEGRWELIEGMAYAMVPSPTIGHQLIGKNILIQLVELQGGMMSFNLDECRIDFDFGQIW
ncbi:MAG: hypothetical protein HY578_01250 [Nitrospinae bacterium]|nr:hypothetical protein [Nitrospinota bacterium]